MGTTIPGPPFLDEGHLDDEAYRLLMGAKIYTSESFSMVVKRLLGTRRPIGESAGAWSDMTDHRRIAGGPGRW